MAHLTSPVSSSVVLRADEFARATSFSMTKPRCKDRLGDTALEPDTQEAVSSNASPREYPHQKVSSILLPKLRGPDRVGRHGWAILACWPW